MLATQIYRSFSSLGLKMRGLPFSAGRDDIRQFFRDYRYREETIKLQVNGRGRPTGEAALMFQDESEAKNAFNQKQGSTMGSRWIELF